MISLPIVATQFSFEPPASTKHHTLNLPDLKYAVAYSLLKPNNLLENNRRKTIANAEKWNLHCSQYH